MLPSIWQQIHLAVRVPKLAVQCSGQPDGTNNRDDELIALNVIPHLDLKNQMLVISLAA